MNPTRDRGERARRPRVLLLGASGQVGSMLAPRLASLLGPGTELLAPSHRELDLSAPDRLAPAVLGIAPDLIVNAAAFTAVDRAEAEPALAHAVNARAPAELARAAAALGALLVHYSTDYVFDGTKTGTDGRPAAYREDDPTNPLGAYGRSKLAGEQAIRDSGCRHLILRTSWVYGPTGHNFARTMLRLAREGRPLRVVADQWGTPTSSAYVADMTCALLALDAGTGTGAGAGAGAGTKGCTGTWHVVPAGATSWHGLARAVLALHGLPDAVEPIATADYPTPARRPANSRLDASKLATALGRPLPDWQQVLREAFTAPLEGSPA